MFALNYYIHCLKLLIKYNFETKYKTFIFDTIQFLNLIVMKILATRKVNKNKKSNYFFKHNKNTNLFIRLSNILQIKNYI